MLHEPEPPAAAKRINVMFGLALASCILSGILATHYRQLLGGYDVGIPSVHRLVLSC